MSQPRISIAMCTYNGEQYVREQLESITVQSLLPFELVVCDDRSTDKTTEIVGEFAGRAKFPVHVHVNEFNVGSTKNFEKAIRLCGGDIIALADQDDVWHPEKLEHLEAVFADSPQVGAAFSDAELVDVALRPMQRSLWKAVGFSRNGRRRLRNGCAFHVLLRHNVVAGATLAFRAEYRPLVIPIPEIWVHDAWIALLIAAVSRMAVIEKPLVSYRQHSGNQLGAIKGLKTQAPRVFSDIFLPRIKRFTDARDRLLTLRSNLGVADRVISELGEKIRHLKVRGAMPRSRLRRLPPATRELFTLRYHRYARGGRSFINDLFRPIPKPAQRLQVGAGGGNGP